MSTRKPKALGAMNTSALLKRLAIMGGALLMVTNAARAIEVAQTLPPLEIAEIQQSKGQFIYIDFWASWCGPCRQSFPWMNALQAKYGSRGLKVVAINVDAQRAEANKFLAHTPAQFFVAFDERAESAKRLAIKTMPTSLLVNPQGRVVWVHSGFRKEDGPELELRIANALVTLP
jgi:cytochrome c biogenesis protein CcmG/thiol:disulfide interchange protein DsbE